jgi:prepilin peptidase CpaA
MVYGPIGAFLAMLVVMSVAGGALTAGMLIDRRIRRKPGPQSPPIEVPYGIAIAFAGLFVLHEPLLNTLW